MAGHRRRCTARGRTDAGQNGGALWTPTIHSYRVVGKMRQHRKKMRAFSESAF
jgi:hypothetical protein